MLPAINRTMGPAEWAMIVLLGLVWGGSFFFYAIAVKAWPVFTIVWLRVAIGAAALWLVVALSGITLPRDPKIWLAFFVMGLINNAIPFSLILYGQKHIASGLAAVLNGATPFFTVLVANAFTRDEPMSARRLTGALVGLGGVAAMISIDALGTLGSALLPQAAVVAAGLSYACASVFGRRFAGLPPILTAAGQTSGSTLLLLPLVLVVDAPWTLSNPGWQVWGAIIGLALLCTSFAYVIFFEILKRAGATNLTLVTFLVPVSAILLGITFLGEAFKPQHAIGMAAIAVGLAIIDGRLMRCFRARS